MPDYCLHCCLKHKECTCDSETRGRPVENYAFCLPAGALLDDKYRIGRVLGAGGFGITYLAVDENLGLVWLSRVHASFRRCEVLTVIPFYRVLIKTRRL